MEAITKLRFMRDYPTDPEALVMHARSWSKFVTVEEKDHELLGKQSPLDWLVQEVWETQDRFPVPIVARRIYFEYWPVEDGKDAYERM